LREQNLRKAEKGMAQPAIIELKKVNKSFFGVHALDNMDFAVRKGEMRSLIGENGCGKSTMIKIISGFYDYDDGELFVNGKKYAKITPIEAMREGIQVIYQDFSLFPNMTVAENILMSKFIESDRKIMNWKETYELAKRQIEQLGVALDPSLPVSEINVAQKQAVAICRALMQNAKLIIMDEPTTALTHKEIAALYKIVEDLLARGISVMFVSHKLDEVESLSSSVTVMRNGKNVFDGPAKGLTKEKMIYYMTGREIAQERYLGENIGGEVVLEACGISDYKHFNDIRFSLRKGEVLGITGLMGSGRSEIAQALFGLLPYEGTVKIKGREAKLADVSEAMANGIAYVPEDRSTEGLHLTCGIGDNAIVCVLAELLGRLGAVDVKKKNTRMAQILSGLEIAGMRYGKEVRLLSGGNQQKVLLVKWMATKPDILILNCPTVGVDVGSKSDIHAIIRKIAGEGVSVIVISDDIPEIMQTCNRMLIVKEGRVAKDMETRSVTIDAVESMLIGSVADKVS
jgi:simple sugar transport system ATP-binding protein